MEFTKIVNSVHYKILDNVIMDESLNGNVEIKEEKYVDEREKCKCNKEDCEKCDPDWEPGADETESDYDSTDSMDEVYEECGLSRSEKKLLQDELRSLIEEAEISVSRPQLKIPTTIPEEEVHPVL